MTTGNHSSTLIGVAAFFALVSIAVSRISLLTVVNTFDDFLTMLQRPKEHLATNNFLHGNFAPVTEEFIGVPVDVVEGAIPVDLEGMFVRTGPNPLPGWTKRYHWFDGHGMLHNLRFKGGKATYSNQFIHTPRYVTEKNYSKDYFLRFGELIGITGLLKTVLVEPVKTKAHGMNVLTSGTANTDTVMFNNRFYLLNEGNLPFEANLNDDGSIESLGFSTFGGVLDYPVSAHPKVDFATNSLLFHSYTADPQLMKEHGAFKVGELLANGTVRNYRGIQKNHTSFAHDMMITENWMVLYDSSVHFDISQMFEGKSVFTWKEHSNLEILLVSRLTGEVKTFNVGSPRGMVHMVNAWEESDGTVVLWAPVGDHLDLELEAGTNFFYMSELRMNPVTGSVSIERIDTEHNQEFCNVRRDFYGRFARYGLAGILDSKSQDGLFRGFIIWDMLEKKAIKIVNYAKDEFGGEPVLLAKPNTTDSRDFYVGNFLYNNANGKSSFVLYDEEALVLRLDMPHRVPFGFHGKWIPEEVLQSHIASRTH
ncbi:oxidoreductase [Fragilaria crotonensis]|nr:oxidoreductase [Fragilaria crotonensis]